MKCFVIVHNFIVESEGSVEWRCGSDRWKKMKCCGMSMSTLVTHMLVADEVRKKESVLWLSLV